MTDLSMRDTSSASSVSNMKWMYEEAPTEATFQLRNLRRSFLMISRRSSAYSSMIRHASCERVGFDGGSSGRGSSGGGFMAQWSAETIYSR